MKPGVAFVVAAVAALAAPSLASAAVLTLDQRCYTTGSTISLSGSGFTDNGEVKLGGAANSTVTTDAGGDFSNVAVTAPDVRTAKPKRFTITATDKARPSVKARVVYYVIGHTWDIYGQMAVYLRLNGITPPRSQRP